MTRIKINIDGEELYLIKTKYHDGNLAIVVNDRFDEPFCKVSVNLPEYKDQLDKLDGEYVFVKNYDENEWVDDLIEQNFFKDTGKRISSGFCSYPLWKVLF